MKKNIHPPYHDLDVMCLTCGNQFTTRSTMKPGTVLKIEACGQCVGQRKITAVDGAVDKYKKRYGFNVNEDTATSA